MLTDPEISARIKRYDYIWSSLAAIQITIKSKYDELVDARAVEQNAQPAVNNTGFLPELGSAD
jgi:hypothetical protein